MRPCYLVHLIVGVGSSSHTHMNASNPHERGERAGLSRGDCRECIRGEPSVYVRPYGRRRRRRRWQRGRRCTHMREWGRGSFFSWAPPHICGLASVRCTETHTRSTRKITRLRPTSRSLSLSLLFSGRERARIGCYSQADTEISAD